MQKHVWIIDDEHAICWALKRALENAGYKASAFSNAEDAISELPDIQQLDAIMLDMRMPGMDGLAAAALLKKERHKTPIIMMTAFGDLSSAMQAMELDVFEYLIKPFDLSDGLKAVAKAIAASSVMQTTGGALGKPENDSLLGSSPSMQQVFRKIAIASHNDLSVLISGPTGLDKESAAAAIHRNSPRQEFPFLAFVPIAISPIALSTEMLGNVQSQHGSDRGVHLRSGAFELAGNGTLYIDEVSDLSLSLQAQLLRVLEHKKYNRLGDATSRECSARIIASTSRNLQTMVADGEFLEELRQRLNVFTIEFAPLAERPEDIQAIANAILQAYSSVGALSFSQAALDWLTSRSWIGDVRELRSVIGQAVVRSRNTCIDVESFIDTEQSSPTISTELEKELSGEIRRWTLSYLDRLGETGRRIQGTQSEEHFGTMYEDFLSMVEPTLLQTMLEASNHNRALVAAQLGMHRSTLRQKMRRYEIE
jgi:two-component system, NtrC family, nitrogen regulation response regulator GlnG